MEIENKTSWGLWVVVIIFFVVVILLISRYWMFQGETSSRIIGRPTFFRQAQTLERMEIKDPGAIVGWNTYSDAQYGFSFLYPNKWELRKGEQPNGLNANWIKPQDYQDCDPEEGCANVVYFGIIDNPDRLSARLLMERKFGWTVEFVRDFRPVLIKDKKCYAFTMMSQEDAHSDRAIWVPLDKTHFLSLSGSYLSEDENKTFFTIGSTFDISKK